MDKIVVSDGCRAVLDAMADAPAAWLTPASIAGAMGRGLEETTDRLSELDVGGWVEVRVDDLDGPPAVMISALGARRLGLRLVEVGPEETPRWARAGEPDPPAPRARHVSLGAQGADLSAVADPGPGPEAAAVLAERAAKAVQPPARPGVPAARRHPTPLPPPSLLLGVGLTPWPGPGQAADPAANCPACGSRKLRPHAYCLYCDRWGLDPHFEASVRAREVPLSQPPVGTPRSARVAEFERQEAERLRALRRARRRGRQQPKTRPGGTNGGLQGGP